MKTQRILVATLVLLAMVGGLPTPARAQAPDEPHADETSSEPDTANVTREDFDRACMMPMDGMMNMSMMAMMQNATPESMMQMCMMPMPPGMMNATDEEHERMFLMRMVMHHRSAVTMADLAVDRAMHPELAGMARNISGSQSAEIGNMTQWLQEWHNATPARDTLMDRMMQTQIDQMASMSGDEFDRAFLDHMIVHHEVAIRMSAPISERLPHAQARDLASAVVTTQQAEIDQMRAWRSAWYPTPATTTPDALPTESVESGRDTPGLLPATLVIGALAASLVLRRRA